MSANVLERQMDDLTVIKGIKAVRQAWLREHLQVMTYEDLAGLSVEQIAEALKQNGRSGARKTVEFWIEAAADLAEEAAQPEKPRSSNEWQPFASFIVEFQERKLAGLPKEQCTKVHYMEEDDGTQWPNLAHAELSAWLKARVGETVLLPPAVSLPEVEPVEERPLPAPEPIQATVTRLVAKQPLQAAEPQLLYEPERPFWGYLQADEPFSVAIELLLENVPEVETAVAAELIARNLSAGANVTFPLQVASLCGGQRVGTAVLSEGILSAGLYRFGLLLKQTQPRSVQFIELPQLQVV